MPRGHRKVDSVFTTNARFVQIRLKGDLGSEIQKASILCAEGSKTLTREAMYATRNVEEPLPEHCFS